MGPRVVATPGRNTIVYGEQGLLFIADSAKYIRELGETDIPIIAIPQARHHVQGGDKTSRWNGGVVLSVAA